MTAAANNKSATLTGNNAGSAVIHIAIGSLLGNSGTITVAAAVVPNGGNYGGGGGGGGGGGSVGYLQPIGFSSTFGMSINTVTGKVPGDVHLVTTDNKVKLDILKDTALLQKSGIALTTLTVFPMANPPAPPAGNALVMAYSFGPDGATFNPELTITLKYDPASLPPNVAEKDLYVAYYDGTSWQNLATTVDPVTKTLTAKISHFSTYAVMGLTAVPAPAVTATPTPTPAVTAIPTPVLTPTVTAAPVITATAPAVTTPAITTPAVTVPASTPAATAAPTPAPKPASNYTWLIILGAVVVIAVVITVIITSRKKRPVKK